MARQQPNQDAAALYDAYGPSLFRYALMILGDHAAAEDVVQQVFVGVLDGGGAIERPGHYLRVAVRNACFSILRRRPSRPAPVTEPALLESVPAAAPLAPEDRLAIEAGIRTLPPEQREVLHLHVFEGLTFRQIAETTGDSANTAASRYRYALEKLRDYLSGENR